MSLDSAPSYCQPCLKDRARSVLILLSPKGSGTYDCLGRMAGARTLGSWDKQRVMTRSSSGQWRKVPRPGQVLGTSWVVNGTLTRKWHFVVASSRKNAVQRCPMYTYYACSKHIEMFMRKLLDVIYFFCQNSETNLHQKHLLQTFGPLPTSSGVFLPQTCQLQPIARSAGQCCAHSGSFPLESPGGETSETVHRGLWETPATKTSSLSSIPKTYST